MNPLTVVLLAIALSFPALSGLLTGSVETDEAGLRVLMAVGAAIVVDRLVAAFVRAVASEPVPALVATGAGEQAEIDAAETIGRRRTDA